jgi:hypothetical protein
MTGHKAALQEEVDAAVRRRREAIEAEDEYNDRRHYNKRSVKDIIERHSQRQDPLLAASLLLQLLLHLHHPPPLPPATTPATTAKM